MVALHENDYTPYLFFQCNTLTCVFPMNKVVEIFRPLPVEVLPKLPAYILGASIVRGKALPVIHMGLFLSNQTQPASRYLSIREAGRELVLAVDTVLGVHNLAADRFAELAPLFQSAMEGVIASLQTFDRQLLTVLSTARILTDDDWRDFQDRLAPL